MASMVFAGFLACTLAGGMAIAQGNGNGQGNGKGKGTTNIRTIREKTAVMCNTVSRRMTAK